MELKIDYKYALQFMYGGNSEFIIENKNTKNKFMFLITKCNSTNDLFFVKTKIKVGNKYESIVYAGYVTRSSNGFKYTQGKNGKVSKDAMSIKALMYTSNALFNRRINRHVIISHVGRCGICGRRLTDEKSIERGFGSYCFEHYVKKGKV